ncbi:DUF6266 family protein [Pedobacter ginsengisoli]|uniref:DUF6266 family protein n=1 Tax=Pedobacter ginsengisoli TaxID=363852 RepID=UPI00254DD563|nr:DUF6266 family protein [Pedobacter ginsengisoli]
MGILHSGLFGGFSKKTGPIVGRRRKGQNVITALHHPSNKAATAGQLDSRNKFSLLNIFLGGISPLLNAGFKKYARTKGAMAAAYSYNYGHAFAVVEGNQYAINYPMMVYSRGPVSGPLGAAVQAADGGITFTWLPQSQSVYCRFTDKATFLVYIPSMEIAFTAIDASDRYAQAYWRELPPGVEGQEVHAYMSFASADGKLTGNSFYAGKVTLP